MTEKRNTLVYTLIISVAMLLSACSSTGATAQTGSDAQMPAADGEDLPEGMEAPEGMPEGEMPEGAPVGEPPDGNTPQEVSSTDESTITESVPVSEIIFDESLPVSETDISSAETSSLNIDGVLVISNKTFIQSHEDLSASEDDQSVAVVTGEGNLTVADAAVTTSGSTSSLDNSRLYGQNAAILGKDDSVLKVLECSLETTGSGANGIFAIDELTEATVIDVTVDNSGDQAHAVMAVDLATMNLENVDLTTSGENASALTIGRGGGTISMDGGTVTTSGSGSPAIHSTGTVTLNDAVVSAGDAEAVVIEGTGSVTITDSEISSSKDDYRGVTFFQSPSDEIEDAEGTFTMSGGSLTYAGQNGPLFFASNANGVVNLSDVEISVDSGVIASANLNESGSTSASITINADNQSLTGILYADDSSYISLNLQNGSVFNGAIDMGNVARTAKLSLDASSTWNVTADSYVTKLTNDQEISEDAAISNIIGNGYTIYYNSNANIYLKGRIYELEGGGYLKPLN